VAAFRAYLAHPAFLAVAAFLAFLAFLAAYLLPAADSPAAADNLVVADSPAAADIRAAAARLAAAAAPVHRRTPQPSRWLSMALLRFTSILMLPLTDLTPRILLLIARNGAKMKSRYRKNMASSSSPVVVEQSPTKLERALL
jgi:hypothetical protein